MPPPSILRTKQSPAGLSAAGSRAGKGRIARARRAACATTCRDNSSIGPFHDPVARYPAAREPRVVGKTRFLEQFLQENAFVGQSLPGLGKKCPASPVGLDDQPVLAGAD